MVRTTALAGWSGAMVAGLRLVQSAPISFRDPLHASRVPIWCLGGTGAQTYMRIRDGIPLSMRACIERIAHELHSARNKTRLHWASRALAPGTISRVSRWCAHAPIRQFVDMADTHRVSVKLLPGAASYQERRRLAALERQRNARREAASKARKLAAAAAEGEDSESSGLQVGTNRIPARR